MRELETERLFLRKFHEEDLEDAYKNWASSKKIAGCFDYKKHESKEESKVMIASLRNEFANGEQCFDVYNCKYRTFKDYDEYSKFICASREIKDKRYGVKKGD